MGKNILYIGIGVPGAGKSTYFKTFTRFNKPVPVVSRDEIRFSIVSETEPYFSKEDEVVKKFIAQINTALKHTDVVADATHLTQKARKTLLSKITTEHSTVAVYFNVPLEVCLERNVKRKGTRSYVPESVIKEMHSKLQEPNFDEGFDQIIYTERWD